MSHRVLLQRVRQHVVQPVRYIHISMLRPRAEFGMFANTAITQKQAIGNCTEYRLPPQSHKNDTQPIIHRTFDHDLFRKEITTPTPFVRNITVGDFDVAPQMEQDKQSNEMKCDSVKRKRHRMMKRHKYRKRLKKTRALRKKLNK